MPFAAGLRPTGILHGLVIPAILEWSGLHRQHDRQRGPAGLRRRRGTGIAGATGGGRLAGSLVGPAGAQVPAAVRHRWVMIALLAELLLVVVAGWWRSGCRSTRVALGGISAVCGDRVAGAGLGLQNATGRRVAAVGLMAAGALVGALLLRVDVALPVLAAVALRFGR